MNKNRTPEGSSSQVNDTPNNPDVAHRGKSRAIEITKRMIAVLGVTAVATFSGACDDQQNSQQGYQPEWHDAQAQRAYDDVIEQQNFLQAQAADYAARQANEPVVAFVNTQPDQNIPSPVPPCIEHTVGSNDTLSGIATEYGFPDFLNTGAVDVMKNLIGKTDTSINPGQKVYVPAIVGNKIDCKMPNQ